MKRDNYYIALDKDGERSWLHVDGTEFYFWPQSGKTPFDEYGQMQGTGFTLGGARKWAPKARRSLNHTGDCGRITIFRPVDGTLVKAPTRPRRKRRKAGRIIPA